MDDMQALSFFLFLVAILVYQNNILVASETREVNRENSKCDFKLHIFVLKSEYLCRVRSIRYSELQLKIWENLSNNRPIYECLATAATSKEQSLYLFYHKHGGWNLEDVAFKKIVMKFNGWAVNPMVFNTSTIKLSELVEVEHCEHDELEQDFHLYDYDSIQKGFTSFYTKIAQVLVDDGFDYSIHFGVSSGFFAWTCDNVWIFSANPENIGGTSFATLRCNSKNQKECLRLNFDFRTYEAAHVEFTFGFTKKNVHQALIEKRNSRRPKARHEALLLNGLHVPLLGLGTGLLDPVQKTLELSKDMGYALVDTAAIYENEKDVGIVFSNVSSRPLIQTKVWPTELGFKRTIRSVMISREELRMSVLDLVLLHWPRCYSEWNVDWMDCSNADPDSDGTLWFESWRALERVYAEGFVLAIGVSNFDVDLLKSAISDSISVVPMLIQNQFSVDHLDLDVVNICKRYGVFYQAYSVFRNDLPISMKSTLETYIRKSHNWKNVQDLRGFIIQLMLKNGIGFLTRSKNATHLKENYDKAENDVIIDCDLTEVARYLEHL
jgi:diketogulonate reductase-like aldo/keto reductase